METKSTNILLAVLLVFSAVCDARAQSSPVKSLATIEKGWRTMDIMVKNGSEKNSVMELLKAFNLVWRTKAAENIITIAGDKNYYVEEWYEGTSPVFVDNEDYCTAWYQPVDANEQQLEVRTYKRSNGHLLFAVRLEKKSPEQRIFCCFYDYNPQTWKLTPEDVPYKNMKRQWKQSRLDYYLGEKFDQTIIVEETNEDGDTCYHHFVWDGMKHTFYETSVESYAPEEDPEDYADENEAP